MGLVDIHSQNAVLEAAEEYDRLGRDVFLAKYGFEPAHSHFLCIGDHLYDSHAILAAAHAYEFPELGALCAKDQVQNETAAAQKLRELDFEIRLKNPQTATEESHSDLLDGERAYRQELWEMLLERGGPKNVSPQLVKDLRIHTVQQGIWTDKTRTKSLTEDGCGVAFAVRHSGGLYADDLGEDGIIYKYPETTREGQDQAEILATKAAAALELPVFVITVSESDPRLRDVSLGFVEDWDDTSKYFLITFEQHQSGDQFANQDDLPFPLAEQLPLFADLAKLRPGKQRFKFGVFKQYGPKCAVCDMGLRELLAAVEMQPKSEGGTEDPRNGLVLCILHQKAFEAGLFSFEPSSLKILAREEGPTLEALQITQSSLGHLPRTPHLQPLEWSWERWLKKAENERK